MELDKYVCLLTDSFPPSVDGVSCAVLNYAKCLQKHVGNVAVIAPKSVAFDQDHYPFDVFRYPSIKLFSKTGYPFGVPFSRSLMKEFVEKCPNLLHVHSPTNCTYLARFMRMKHKIPIILTYHTKYDIEIASHFSNGIVQNMLSRLLLNNISTCDDVWAVSRGAAENLRTIGYTGEITIIPNGVDIRCEKKNSKVVRELKFKNNIPIDIPLFLYVGRLRWYKGIKTILDAIKEYHSVNDDYRMVFIGVGQDQQKIEEYAKNLGIRHRVIFLGMISDRKMLQAWYWSATLFLFPSTFDTDGLVVKEAAACYLPSILIRNSSAAEKIVDGKNGFLIDNNSKAMAAKLIELTRQPKAIYYAGHEAATSLFMSWDQVVAKAYSRYNTIMDRYYKSSGIRKQ